MRKFSNLFLALLIAAGFSSCQNQTEKGKVNSPDIPEDLYKTIKFEKEEGEDFLWKTEQFKDLKILRYQVPGFDELSLRRKKLVYYLSQAALSGRDIIYDQNYRHNLYVRNVLENIYKTYEGEKSGIEWEGFNVYLKRVWFSNGIHHHYSSKKMKPGFTFEYFEKLVHGSDAEGFPLQEDESIDIMLSRLKDIIFNPDVDAKRVNKDEGVDMIQSSANNYYGEDITQKEAEEYYNRIKDEYDENPPSYGLNSKLVKENGEIVEKKYQVGGMYSDALEEIVKWLKKAHEVAENDQQAKAIEYLIDYYMTGDLETFDKYNIAWVKDTESEIDFINGFIEVYGDPMGYKGAYESVIQMKDKESSERMKVLADNAQWFEDRSTIMPEHKREKVTGVSYKVITVAMESGDASPSTPIGINLPNSNWIRANHGSKSVSLGNIKVAYENASGGELLQEFAYTDEEYKRSKKYGTLAGKLHTAMHEVIGHASGKLNPGVGSPRETLKNYASTLEEGRADLVALYYLMDPKLMELGLMPDLEVGMAEYDSYIRNGMLMQLRRLDLGENIEEDHMRNRQLIAKWVYEKGKEENVIEKKVEEGKTYFVINDYGKLRELFGELLKEIQRIKSEGDYKSGKTLVEDYGVKVDQELHKEVLDRVKDLSTAPYGGFINPSLEALRDDSGEIIDVKVTYPDDFTQQHLGYGEKYSFLPIYN